MLTTFRERLSRLVGRDSTDAALEEVARQLERLSNGVILEGDSDIAKACVLQEAADDMRTHKVEISPSALVG
jgi:hypothetical protein